MTLLSCGVEHCLPATRLACLRDVMALKRVQRAPVVRLTASAAAAAGDQQHQQPKQQKHQQQQQQQQKPV